jgi:hypothetical protein
VAGADFNFGISHGHCLAILEGLAREPNEQQWALAGEHVDAKPSLHRTIGRNRLVVFNAIVGNKQRELRAIGSSAADGYFSAEHSGTNLATKQGIHDNLRGL